MKITEKFSLYLYSCYAYLGHEFQKKNSQSQNSIQHFEFSRTFSSTGSAGKFKMSYRVLTLRFFLLKSMLLKKITHLNFRAKINNFKNETCYDDFQTVCILPLKIGIVL